MRNHRLASLAGFDQKMISGVDPIECVVSLESKFGFALKGALEDSFKVDMHVYLRDFNVK